ncbi:Prefoldin subunit 6 [Mycena sanguinolenta]|uniref:Prefoldin subunit 6 n=1 Tax=Mycena sanguinolenta TaxID=230812 RepID=A0A8H7CKJ7_9AGAR|nr:Prefoldin subunit 6 [Mycena sanguinolenta]
MSLQLLQTKLKTASAEYQKLQADLANVVAARQRLDAQLSENDLVKKEFAQLAPDNIVYKQIGPVLVKQDQAEAKSNVETRLEFIKGEIKRVEAQLQDIESKSDIKKNEARRVSHPALFTTNIDLCVQLVEIQAALQQAAQQTGAAASGASLPSLGGVMRDNLVEM